MNIITMAKAGLAVVKTFAVVNAPIIFIGAAAVGVVSTAVIAWKAGKKSSMVLGKAKVEKGEPLTKVEKVKATWKLWLPVCVSIILTFGCMGASYYIHSVRLAEMTATANALLVSNKELNKELNDLYLVGPEEAERIRDETITNRIHSTKFQDEYGDIIYDEFLQRSFRMPIDSAIAARDKFLEYYQENNKAKIKDLYYFLGQPLGASAGNLGWVTAADNVNDLDFPFINFKKKTIDIDDDGEVETRYHLIYYPQSIETVINGDAYCFGDDLINDDELLSGIGKAFA